MVPAPPEIFVLGGPNGAGKSTTAAVLLPETLHVEQFVNADLIAKGLSPFAPETIAFQASRLMLQRIRQLRAAGVSFAFETTLATKSYVPFLRDAGAQGYLVHVIFIALSSVALARARVRDRVRQGGHDVPDNVIERRFDRGLRNFFTLYMPLADTWTLCDNSGPRLLPVAGGDKATGTQVENTTLFERIRRQANA